MKSERDCLCVGAPRFAAAALAHAEREQGAAVAWALAVQGGFDAAVAAVAGAQGDFALAWRAADGSALLAVDRFAIRTLCYRVVDGELRFAERADALADAAPALAPQAIFDYLYFHAIPSPRTIFDGVHRLPPGHVARFENGRLTVAPYWTPCFDETLTPSFDALKAEFRGLLRDAVARSLDGSRPACFLSGGTDSSTVAGLIREVAGRGAASYSIGFEAEGYDEMAYARLAARHFGCEHHEYYVTPDDLVRSIGDVAAAYDQPFGNSSVLPTYYCALKAREDGVTRLLAGDGGDELFGGNSRYALQKVFGLYGALPGWLRGGVMQPLFDNATMRRLPLLRKGSGYIEQARVPLPDRLQMYNLLRRLGLAEVLTPALLAQVDVDHPAAQQREVWAMAGQGSALNRMLAFDWRYTLAESDLPKVRGATALAGVEVGFPLLDRALADFSLRLPTGYKLRGYQLRWFFKQALNDFLPPQIITKKKHGFGLPFGVWVTRHAGLRALAVDALHGVAERGIVRPEFIRTLIESHLPAHPGYYGEMVWILMMLEQWLRRHAPAYRLAR